MSYRYVKESDELRIFQDYRGIFGGDGMQQVGEGAPAIDEDKSDELSDQGLADFGFLLSGQKVYFFSSWLFVFDRERLENPEKDLPKEMKALFKLLLENVSVRDAKFYLDDEDRFSGIQSVTV